MAIIVARVLEIMSALLIGVAGPPVDCSQARNQYESLSLEVALETAEVILARDESRPLECLEVKALVQMVLGQIDESRAGFEELFARAPDHVVRDPSLPPAMRDAIEAIRENIRALSATVRARWLIHESMAIDMLLRGGLRDATKIRYQAELRPTGQIRQGELVLVGRTATATVSVPSSVEVAALHVTGSVIGARDGVLYEFSSDLLAPARPELSEKLIVTTDSGIGWPVWAGIGAGVVGAVVAIVILSQPNLPEAKDTLGRVSVP